jgi:molybdopterin-guanine dinucleotide biosynthesis protein MobB
LRVVAIVDSPRRGIKTFLVALVPLLRASGLPMSKTRRLLQGFEMDQSGKSSYPRRLAGAHQFVVAIARRRALLHKAERPEPNLNDLPARIAAVRAVLVKGFKSYFYRKLEMFRPVLVRPPLWDRG